MNQKKHFIVDLLFIVTLFCVFALCALMLVTIGAKVYRNTVDDMGSNFETRTSVSYLTEKIRQNDTIIDNVNISVATIYNIPALLLTQDVEGDTYCTYLYLHDGYLKELFMKSTSYLGDNLLSAGQKIIELSDFEPKQCTDNLFSVQLTTPDGETHTIYISTHCTP